MSDYIQTSFLTPCNEDSTIGNGKPHPPGRLDWLKSELCENFGGWTKAPGIYNGSWVNPATKEIVDDESHQWLIAIPKSHLNKMRVFIGEVALRFRQQCIFFSYEGRVEFIEYTKG